ncbi:hypothetical protein EYF80_028662 [Liparis tanakae]|uniref:Uncharacterized protein n=1 Tax=Liparis tanakae TaxID=230148 RepID=A0A4Z2H8G6_9TELE|nr:hypothetical protein EYF80_028662 [Liparis tanakae]
MALCSHHVAESSTYIPNTASHALCCRGFYGNSLLLPGAGGDQPKQQSRGVAGEDARTNMNNLLSR